VTSTLEDKAELRVNALPNITTCIPNVTLWVAKQVSVVSQGSVCCLSIPFYILFLN